MWRSRPIPAVLAIASLVVVALGQRASAQTEGERAAAQALFDQGKQLRDKGEVEQACSRFAESLRLDPTVGTRFNLADCYERIGRLASAWTQFLDVAAATELAGQQQRSATARARAEALRPRLPTLQIRPAEPLAGLRIRVDGTELREAAWATDVPVDLGSHEIEASAPGRKPWREHVVFREERERRSVTIPELALAPKTATPGQQREPDGAAARADGEAPSPGAAVGTAGLVLGAVGLGGLGVGVGFGIAAMNGKSEVDELCPDENDCTPEGIARNDEARTAGHVSTIGFVAGGALLLTGLVMWLAAPDEPAPNDPSASSASWSFEPMLGPWHQGARIRGAF